MALALQKLTGVLSFNTYKNSEKGNEVMKNEYHNNLIVISVNNEFGLTSDANGILFAIPIDKAYKI